jgi:CubicO group peptidase (beta-lactamase class C family)
LRHLLSHTSGIPDYADESKLCAGDVVGGWGVHPATLRSLADYAARLPRGAPAFPPGEKYEYSNSNYVLLGLVLERVSGLSYEACLDREVLRPAGMTDTGLFALDEVRPRVATGYLPPGPEQGAGAPWRSNVLAVPARGGPDGGIYATAADLLAFVEALHGHRLLTPATTRLMLDAKVWEDEQWGYAYGFQHRKLGDGTAAVGHSGEDPGASARVFWTEGGWTVIVLSNMSRATGEVVWPIVRATRAEA